MKNNTNKLFSSLHFPVSKLLTYLPFIICFIFFIAYSVLSVVKHNHFLSGYDLAVSDQGIWLMSQFKNPISTPHAYPFTSLFTDHVEIIYALISPIYWFFDDVRVLIILQALAITFSGIPIFLLAKEKKLHPLLSYTILISFLLFYGIQNAIWADVHSLVFAASFLPWFMYFLEKKNIKWSSVFFVLLIICKEDIALLTFLISFVHFLRTRWKPAIFFMLFSVLYLFIIFFIYFPFFTRDGYRFQNENGLLSNIDLTRFYNTSEKRDVIIYSLSWFGLLPLLSPLYLLPFIGDLGHYFVLGSDYVTSAQGMFLHYRVTLASLMVVPTILVLAKYKKLNNFYVAMYLLVIALFLQYHLHLPLSYLAKRWFWTEPQGARNIKEIIQKIPENAAIVSQNNITPHLNHRELIFTLWPTTKTSEKESYCDKTQCDWFRWPGNPEFLIVDTSSEWDARHWLTNRENVVNGLANMEKAGYIKLIEEKDTAKLYKVLKNSH